jgi:hypothetical protein
MLLSIQGYTQTLTCAAPESKSVKVYPSPSTGQFTLDMKNIGSRATVAIYSMRGEMICRTSVAGRKELKIDLAAASRGICLVRVTDQQEQFTTKVIVN